MAANWLSPRRVMSRPSSTMRPLVGVSRPAISPSRVDFPEPLGPVSATHSPGAMVRETPFKIATSAWPSGSERVRSVASTAAGAEGFVMSTTPGEIECKTDYAYDDRLGFNTAGQLIVTVECGKSRWGGQRSCPPHLDFPTCPMH